ncbi:single-stranded-DNA-specific exonuclease RecJ, partial [Francisella tularensis subsp. holarctica]|nr:single-stranded-DNA-specific exonuclease RecJ [Francisella tularensis subsp. holarctica]
TDIITKQNIILEPIIEYDFELAEHHFELETLDKIDALDPFGREFEKPLFCNQFMVENLRLVGNDKNHAQLVLRYKNI